MDNTNLAGATIQITGNYQNGQDVLSLHEHGQHHGKLERRHGHADPERQRHGGQLPGGVAGGEVPEHQRQPQRGLTRTVSFKVNDGTADSNTRTRDIAVTAVNDAPVLDNSGVFLLSAITEDQVSNAGDLVADIIAAAGGDRITDLDSGR